MVNLDGVASRYSRSHSNKQIDQDNVMFRGNFLKRGWHNLGYIRFKSSVKTISWRLWVAPETLMIAWMFAGNLKLVGSTMMLEIFTKMSLYCLHEHVWTLSHGSETGIS